ncbi:MAG: TonB-dependent receptor [Candidatus Methylopumilus sp.]|nr:TonB-dependent receptor [Candidatus Methylopumilus sp.]
MKKIILLALAITLFTSILAMAQSDLKTDDIFVTASRTPIPKNNIIADTTTISSEEIKRASSSTLVELLQRQSGIEISNQGGPGQLSTIFLRGNSSTHVVILIDGLRVNAATSSLTALSNISLSQIDKIEIVRGSASSLYGPDAIGGVIQIFTKQGLKGFNPYIAVGLGRYNTKSVQAGIRSGDEDTSYSINISGFDTTGFSAYNTNNPLLNDKDGFTNLSISGSFSHKLNENHQIGFQFFNSNSLNHYDNHNDPAFGTDYQKLDFKNQMVQESYAVNLKNNITENWSSNFKIGRGIDKSIQAQVFNLDNFIYSLAHDKNITTQDQLSWQNDFKLPMGNVTLLFDQLDQKIDADTIYDKTQRKNKGYMLGYSLNQNKHDVQVNYRIDDNSVYKQNETANIGYAYHLNETWRLASTISKAFKEPSFDVLYFPADNFGSRPNPNLKPEKSFSKELSLRYQKDLENFSMTYYKNNVKKLISNVFDPVTGLSTPQNISQAEISSLLFSANKFIGHFEINGNYTFQSTENLTTHKDLNLRASQYGNLGLNYYVREWKLGIESSGSGLRYQDTSNTIALPGYILMNIVADYKVNDDLTLNMRLNNLLNKEYELNFSGSPRASGFASKSADTSFFINLRYEPK